MSAQARDGAWLLWGLLVALLAYMLGRTVEAWHQTERPAAHRLCPPVGFGSEGGT